MPCWEVLGLKITQSWVTERWCVFLRWCNIWLRGTGWHLLKTMPVIVTWSHIHYPWSGSRPACLPIYYTCSPETLL
jgi:hypothetical protein